MTTPPAAPLFGGYELERPLGHGGMAETFLATHRGPQGFVRRVCLKRILPSLAADAAFVRAFQEEARLAVRLVHPHIAQVYDFGSDQGTWWMTLEYIGGGDLRELMKRMGTPLEVDFARVLIIDIASALAYAHELEIDGSPAHIVHRDVSPSNVLVDALGNFKLADFGIAKSALSTSNTTRGAVKGKAWYMSPEQASGKRLDGTADLWALGVVLYEALSGRRPFDGATDLATMLQVLEGKRPKLIEVAPHVPAAFCDVIERLLCVAPEGRFASASALLDALAEMAPQASTRRRLAARIKELSARTSTPAMPLPTRAITALALDDASQDTVQTALPDEATRTRTSFDQALHRAVELGAFDATTKLESAALPASEPAATALPAPAPIASPVREPEAKAPSRWPLAVGLVLVLTTALTLALAALWAWPHFMPSVATVVASPDAGARLDAALAPPDAAQPPEPPRGIEVPAEFMTGLDVPALEVAEHTAESAREFGTLRIVVEPWGRVVVDGRDVGASPFSGRVRAGQRVIEGVAGQQRVRRTVLVEPDATTRVRLVVP